MFQKSIERCTVSEPMQCSVLVLTLSLCSYQHIPGGSKLLISFVESSRLAFSSNSAMVLFLFWAPLPLVVFSMVMPPFEYHHCHWWFFNGYATLWISPLKVFQWFSGVPSPLNGMVGRNHWNQWVFDDCQQLVRWWNGKGSPFQLVATPMWALPVWGGGSKPLPGWFGALIQRKW